MYMYMYIIMCIHIYIYIHEYIYIYIYICRWNNSMVVPSISSNTYNLVIVIIVVALQVVYNMA